jgi:hypothetical protein
MSKKVKKRKLAKAICDLALSVDWGEQHRKALRKSVKVAERAGDMQTARNLAYQLAREEGVRVRKTASNALASIGTNEELQARDLLFASERSIRNAQLSFDRGAGRSQRQTLQSAYRGDYRTENPEEVMAEDERIREAARALAKAVSPQEREIAGYRLTREQLKAGHRRGEI